MLQTILRILKIVGTPILTFILLELLYKKSSNLKFIKRIKIALHLVFILTALSIFWEFVEFPYVMTIRQINYLLLGFGVFFIIVKILEVFFVENILIKERGIKIPVFVRDLVRLFILVAVVVTLLKIIFGIEPSAFIVTSTVLSAVIGLAMQDILANIFSGIAMQFERPFDVGDWVMLNNREGKVVEMSWRTTKIKTRDNDHVITPNTTVAKDEIINFNDPSPLHAVRLSIGTSYSDPPLKVKKSIKTVVKSTDYILKKPHPEIYLKSYNDFSINYEIKFWIDDYSHAPIIKDNVMTNIWYQFQKDNIEIPFPIRNVYLKESQTMKNHETETYQTMLDEIVESIHDIDILQPFSQEQLYELAKKTKVRIYRPGEPLIQQGERGGSFFIIKSGVVEVLVTSKGKKKSLGNFGEDYYFGEVALLTGEPRNATVIAREYTEALVIDKENFGSLLRENPEIAESLSDILSKRITELEELKSQKEKTTIITRNSEKESKKILGKIRRFFGLR